MKGQADGVARQVVQRLHISGKIPSALEPTESQEVSDILISDQQLEEVGVGTHGQGTDVFCSCTPL